MSEMAFLQLRTFPRRFRCGARAFGRAARALKRSTLPPDRPRARSRSRRASALEEQNPTDRKRHGFISEESLRAQWWVRPRKIGNFFPDWSCAEAFAQTRFGNRCFNGCPARGKIEVYRNPVRENDGEVREQSGFARRQNDSDTAGAASRMEPPAQRDARGGAFREKCGNDPSHRLPRCGTGRVEAAHTSAPRCSRSGARCCNTFAKIENRSRQRDRGFLRESPHRTPRSRIRETRCI